MMKMPIVISRYQEFQRLCSTGYFGTQKHGRALYDYFVIAHDHDRDDPVCLKLEELRSADGKEADSLFFEVFELV